MEKYDLIVIGAGPGGYPAAIRAAQLGASVAIVEKEALGGTCLNWGCIPTKTLIASASLYWHMQHAQSLGVSVEKASFDYAAMIRHKNQVVEKLRAGVGQLLKANGIKVFEGTASFMTRNRLAVQRSGKESVVLEAARIIIATGSSAALPGFLPKAASVVESRAFLDLPRLPARLIVLGGGVIGCELACMAAQLGVQVTIVEILDDILVMLDADVRAEARRYMESHLKIRILTGKPLEQIKAGAQGVKGHVAGEEIEADLLLAAVGRRPVTEKLDLDKAGLKPNEKGYIEVNSACQTKAAGIYAIGDVNGGPQLAHAATAQGLLAAEHAVGPRRNVRAQIVPSCIFTAPEIAVVGISEQEAKQQNRAVKTGKFHFAALGKAIASGETTGFVKWIVDADTDQLLGAAAIGAHATELIATAVTAVQAELTAAEFAHTIQAHPTLSEAWMEAAHAVHAQCIHAPPRRRKTDG
ncbi:MAG: dihydrolipoyl dehydrogenase [Kiritimatiellae bacterium]|nr:dihydrolipoyl dehydrogenase [Kiritimatiellia bacterium]